MPSLKTKLTQTVDRLTCQLCTIPSAAVSQAFAASGADAVIIDLEHGAIDYGSAHAMIAATAGTDCAPLVRISEIDAVQCKRALDLGAEGIVFPLARNVADVERAVASLLYPPNGVRGFGPFIAQSRWNTTLAEYRDKMEPQLICCILIETTDAVENIEHICNVEGIDLIIPATFDLSSDMGISGQFDHPDFQAALARIEKAAKSANIPLGGVALNQTQAETLFARGYRMITGFDLLWLREKTFEMRAWSSHETASKQ
ncbi:MAG: aldolase/citrate lyase family protein [Paracoccaceae bacterium]